MSQPLPLLNAEELANIERQFPVPAPTGERTLHYPFSNDEPSYHTEETLSRFDDYGFQHAPRPVVVVIGEAALAGALTMLHRREQIVFVCDNDDNKLHFMRTYRDNLRTSATAPSWIASLALASSDLGEFGPSSVRHSVEAQASAWEAADLYHPIRHAGSYLSARRAAINRAIIPYRIDMTNPDDLVTFSERLRGIDAQISLLNLTNIMTWHGLGGQQMAELLGVLPMVHDAPILATSGAQPAATSGPPGAALSAIGPFMGRHQLAQYVPS